MAIPSWKLFSRAGCGQHLRHQAGRRHPALHLQPRSVARRCRPSARCRQYRLRHRPAAGAALVEHPDVRAISFTGSSSVGSLVAQRAAVTFKQVSLEMGGKNAQIVLDDANLDLALDGALWGAFGTTGQRCTATSRILLQKGIAAEFTERFVARAKKLKVGNGLDESVEVGPQVNGIRSRLRRAMSRSRWRKARGCCAAATR